MAPKTYKGRPIYECERVKGEHRGRWIVQTYHYSGMRYADELCPHFGTLADAREYITEEDERDRLIAEHEPIGRLWIED